MSFVLVNIDNQLYIYKMPKDDTAFSDKPTIINFDKPYLISKQHIGNIDNKAVLFLFNNFILNIYSLENGHIISSFDFKKIHIDTIHPYTISPNSKYMWINNSTLLDISNIHDIKIINTYHFNLPCINSTAEFNFTNDSKYLYLKLCTIQRMRGVMSNIHQIYLFDIPSLTNICTTDICFDSIYDFSNHKLRFINPGCISTFDFVTNCVNEICFFQKGLSNIELNKENTIAMGIDYTFRNLLVYSLPDKTVKSTIKLNNNAGFYNKFIGDNILILSIDYTNYNMMLTLYSTNGIVLCNTILQSSSNGHHQNLIIYDNTDENNVCNVQLSELRSLYFAKLDNFIKQYAQISENKRSYCKGKWR